VANTSAGSGPYSPAAENAYNLKPEYAPSSFEQRYRSSIVGTYALPFGVDKRYANKGGIVSAVVGGWQFSAILMYAGGFPMGVINYFNPLMVSGFDRPNIVKGVPLRTFSYGRSKNFFTGKTPVQPVQFTTNAFQNTGPWELGDSVRAYSALRTSPLRFESFDVIKNFHLWEGLRASLRLDYFNAFNRTRLLHPDTNSLNSTFGKITNRSSGISNRQGQASFRVEF
jgi:hypothetical protein